MFISEDYEAQCIDGHNFRLSNLLIRSCTVSNLALAITLRGICFWCLCLLRCCDVFYHCNITRNGCSNRRKTQTTRPMALKSCWRGSTLLLGAGWSLPGTT